MLAYILEVDLTGYGLDAGGVDERSVFKVDV